jgi:riboflavin biosynthesis pyrimidine reductase
LWSLDDGQPNTATAWQHETERSCGTVLRLVQVLVRRQAVPRHGLWIVTRGAQPAVAGDAIDSLGQTPAWGLGKVIALEHPELGCQRLKDATPAGVLLGSGTLATELDRLDLIDEYQFLVHPRIAGHGPTLYQSGLPATRRLELISARPLRSGAVAMHYRRAR